MRYTLTFVSVASSGLRYIDEVLTTFAADESFGSIFEEEICFHNFFIGEIKDHSKKFPSLKEAILSSQFVYLDLMGADNNIVSYLEELVREYQGDIIVGGGTATEYLRSRTQLGSFSPDKIMKMMASMKGKKDKESTATINMEKMIDRMEALGKMVPVGPLQDMRNLILLEKFWRYACPENIRNMILLVCRNYGKIKGLPKQGKLIDFSRYVFFDPQKLQGFETLAELKNEWGWNENLKTVGVLFSSINYPNYTFGILAQVIDRLKQRYNVVPLGISLRADMHTKLNKILSEGLKIDLLWDFLPFRLGAGPMGGDEETGLDILRRLNCSIMHPIFLGKRKIVDWEELTGLSPMEIIIHIMLPEMDGVIDTIPLAALAGSGTKRISDLQELEIIGDRLEKLLRKTSKYISLRHKKNKEKRLAFVMYNYPPGEGGVGGGAFLDTFCSIERICKVLKNSGYNVGDITAAHLEDVFMNKGECNSAKWSESTSIQIRYNLEKYLPKAGASLDEYMIRKSSNEWQEPPGTIMATKKEFLIPGIQSGNVFIGLQPSRGSFEDPSKLHHDKVLPPHHQYMAFYRWLEREFKADAVIHVGTHGTLEFLPGKESGLSQHCYPDYLIGTIPHFYFYYTGNPSEATIAKRRTYGCLISYSGPSFRRSGAYGEYMELEDLINGYLEAAGLAPQQRQKQMEKITEKVAEMKLIVDDREDIDSISKELIRLKTSLMPVGLHEIGKPFSEKEIACFLSAILNWNRGEFRSINDIIVDTLIDKDGISELKKQEELFDATEKLVEDYFFGNRQFYKSVYNQLSPVKAEELSQAMQYGEKCLKNIQETTEIAGLLHGLDNDFVEAHLGGDVIRDPEVFPTGYNIYQFDARLVPSDVAMERGIEIAESTLKFYVNQHSTYPVSIAVVLWGLETSRTKGETIGQILGYLGVRIKKDPMTPFNKKFEIIPLEELKRPRIDCTITICGFFRDMFPNILVFLDEVYEAVSNLDEPEEMNFVRKHTRSHLNELLKEMPENLAQELSHARIFGPPEGQYGTGITTLIENKNWEEEVEIANAYLAAQKHVYTRTRRGQAQKKLFESNLEKIDLVSQVRSSVDYSLTDLDHYYEYFGGLAKSVETVRGSKPTMLFTDSSSNTIYTDEAKKAVEIGVRTRLLNPEYINEMLKHKVHGAQHIYKRIENLIGLAATTGSVPSWIFSSVKETFIDDQEMYEKLKENNMFATSDLIERLFEANKRGYWEAKAEEIEELRHKYLQLEGVFEDDTAT